MTYHNKIFRAVQNTENGETSSETQFHYQQEGNILFGTYAGGRIVRGHLIGLVDDRGNIDMRYQQINSVGDIMTGTCQSKPEIMENGKIRLHESWKWTSGDLSSGTSVVEEVS